MRIRSVVSSVVAVLVSAVLVVTVVTPVAAEEGPLETVAVPPLVSAPLELPESTTPEGDFANVSSAPVAVPTPGVGGARPTVPVLSPFGESSFDEATSVVESRTEFTTVYTNADGTETVEIGQLPLNARDDSKAWVPVDTQLVKDADGRWSTGAHPLDPSFATRADEEGAFSVLGRSIRRAFLASRRSRGNGWTTIKAEPGSLRSSLWVAVTETKVQDCPIGSP